MKRRFGFLGLLGVAPVVPPAAIMMAQQSGASRPDTDSNCNDFQMQDATPGAPNKLAE